MTPPAPPSVTQADRDAAAGWMRARHPDSALRDLQEAFARHRTTAEAASRAEIDELVGALADLLPTVRCMERHGVRFDPAQVDAAVRVLAKHQQGEADEPYDPWSDIDPAWADAR